MAWENRRGKRYYYRKQRVGERVTSAYLGNGPVAQLCADEDDTERRRLALAWAGEAESRRQEKRLARLVDGFAAAVGRADAARLLLNGYHTHRRQWRARRGPVAPTLG